MVRTIARPPIIACAQASLEIACKVRSSRSLHDQGKLIQEEARKHGRQAGGYIPNDEIITRKYSTTFPPGTRERFCEVKIVTSHRENPSPFEGGDDLRLHATIRVNLSLVQPSQMEEKNNMWYKKAIGKKHHIKLDFVIKIKLDSAKLSFQCCKKFHS
ncbi:Fc.00g008800.m01.CDS01 [Cosmosporella sp. VM-42]